MRFHEPFGIEQAAGEIMKALRESAAGDGNYTRLCQQWLQKRLGCPNVLMTTSCTHALELALQLLELEPGDEVIVPSFTYPSTANAVLLAGGRVVYGEVEAAHLTLDPLRLERHITPRTRAIVVVHYGGMCADMTPIMEIAVDRGLVVIEDGAQSFLSAYGDRHAGTLGHMGCLSFHGTKDVIAGEGGALLVNDRRFLERAQVFRLKGTNSQDFKEGRVSHYQWVSKGSSYSPSELTMALLYSQLQLSGEIRIKRRAQFAVYAAFFRQRRYGQLEGFSTFSEHSVHNGHLYYIIFRKAEEARKLREELQTQEIPVQHHFVPLHESAMGKQFVRSDNCFETEAGLGQRLLRLPLYPSLCPEQQQRILDAVDSLLGGAV